MNAFGCNSCGKEIDERQLVSKSVTVENCPYCGTMVRKSEGFGSTNLAAIISEDIAAIDAWLARYSTETSNQVVRRSADRKHHHWSVGSQYKLAIECLYDERTNGLIELRGITSDSSETVLQHSDQLAVIASRFGIQPCGERQTGWSITDGDSIAGFWGMVQYANINVLSTLLLNAVIDRLNDAMRSARSELLGGPKA